MVEASTHPVWVIRCTASRVLFPYFHYSVHPALSIHPALPPLTQTEISIHASLFLQALGFDQLMVARMFPPLDQPVSFILPAPGASTSPRVLASITGCIVSPKSQPCSVGPPPSVGSPTPPHRHLASVSSKLSIGPCHIATKTYPRFTLPLVSNLNICNLVHLLPLAILSYNESSAKL